MLNLSNHIDDYIIYNYEQKKVIKKKQMQDFMGEINIFFCSQVISPWVSFATCLNLEALQENIEKNQYIPSFKH